MHVLERSGAESTRMSTKDNELRFVPMWADKKKAEKRIGSGRKIDYFVLGG